MRLGQSEHLLVQRRTRSWLSTECNSAPRSDPENRVRHSAVYRAARARRKSARSKWPPGGLDVLARIGAADFFRTALGNRNIRRSDFALQFEIERAAEHGSASSEQREIAFVRVCSGAGTRNQTAEIEIASFLPRRSGPRAARSCNMISGVVPTVPTGEAWKPVGASRKKTSARSRTGLPVPNCRKSARRLAHEQQRVERQVPWFLS